MKGATQCAKRLKKYMCKLKPAKGKDARGPTGEILDQLILGIFSRDVPESRAREVLDRLRANVVDYNELRVIPPIELADIVGDQPGVRLKCEDLSRALNRIFAREHWVTLDHLKGMNKRDVAAYLDDIDGLEAYTRARVRLYGLGRHAIPLDAAMWALARKEELVNPTCPLDEAQAFLERQISEADAPAFLAAFRKQAWVEMGPAVRKGSVEPIESVPPDRTTRNMLQMVAGGASHAATRSAAQAAQAAAAAARPPAPTVHQTPRRASAAPAKPEPKRKTRSTSKRAKSPAKKAAKTTAKRKTESRATSRAKPKRSASAKKRSRSAKSA